MTPGKKEGAVLLKRFYLTELLANAIGAPLAVAYGGAMLDFTRVQPLQLALLVLAVMVVNQAAIALPLNVVLGKRLREGLASRFDDRLDEKSKESFIYFLSGLPALRAILVFARMSLCSLAIVLLIADSFHSFSHGLATFLFGCYASFLAGMLDFYFLRSATAPVLEDAISREEPDSRVIRTLKSRSLGEVMEALPFLAPTAIAGAGVACLAAAMGQAPSEQAFFALRIEIAVALNLLTIGPVFAYGKVYRRRRMRALREALDDMATRGDVTREVPTDLSDAYATTAWEINRAFGLFRLVLARLDAASSGVAETVMGFSSQINETVAATTQQAASVKEIVGTMEGSLAIAKRIADGARGLTEVSRESQSLVHDGFGRVQDSIQKMAEIKEANERTLAEINDVAEEVSSVGEIVELIANIAYQTRIIAFNAELEASSAGEAGTSFRIVAEEIRRLANGTVESLSLIRSRVAQISGGAERLLASSEEGTAKIAEGIGLSAGLNDIFMKIREKSEASSASSEAISSMASEQSRAFDQIFLTLKQVSEGAEQVLSSAKASGSEVSRLKALTDELSRLLSRFDRRDEASVAEGVHA
jgi:methyl-accepting chemotaxis protein